MTVAIEQFRSVPSEGSEFSAGAGRAHNLLAYVEKRGRFSQALAGGRG